MASNSKGTTITDVATGGANADGTTADRPTAASGHVTSGRHVTTAVMVVCNTDIRMT